MTVPARGEGIWFIVFMASMMSRVWPSRTCWPTSMKALGVGRGGRIGGADHRRGHGILRGIGRSSSHRRSSRLRLARRWSGRGRSGRPVRRPYGPSPTAAIRAPSGHPARPRSRSGWCRSGCPPDRGSAAGQHRFFLSTYEAVLVFFSSPVKTGRPAPSAPGHIRAGRSRRSSRQRPGRSWIDGERFRAREYLKDALRRPEPDGSTGWRHEWRSTCGCRRRR